MNTRFSPPVQGIVDSVKSFFKGTTEEGNAFSPLDHDEDEHQLYKEDIIENIMSELELRRTAKSAIEQQWRLNANFLVGNQYCDINPYSRDIEQLEPVYDWLERETFNQIAPLIDTRIANLKKINYRMRVKPRTNELEDYQKAEISTTVLQYLQTSSDFDSKKNTAIQWNELAGNCFWLSWWNTNAGDIYATEHDFIVDDDGVEHEKETRLWAVNAL